MPTRRITWLHPIEHCVVVRMFLSVPHSGYHPAWLGNAWGWISNFESLSYQWLYMDRCNCLGQCSHRSRMSRHSPGTCRFCRTGAPECHPSDDSHSASSISLKWPLEKEAITKVTLSIQSLPLDSSWGAHKELAWFIALDTKVSKRPDEHS